MDLKSVIRTIPDYPKPGIMFRDITTLLGDSQGLKAAIAQNFNNGFLFGGHIHNHRGCRHVAIHTEGITSALG